MTDFYDPYGQFIILDRVHDAIQALANAIPFPAGQFFTAGWSRICGEHRYAFKDLLEILFGFRLEVILDRSLEKDLLADWNGYILLLFILKLFLC